MEPKKGFSEKNLTPEQKRQFEAMKNTAAKYRGKSEEELMRELKLKGRPIEELLNEL